MKQTLSIQNETFCTILHAHLYDVAKFIQCYTHSYQHLQCINILQMCEFSSFVAANLAKRLIALFHRLNLHSLANDDRLPFYKNLVWLE